MEAGEALETALEAVQTLEAAEALETSAEDLWTSLEAAEELEMVGMQQCLRRRHHCLEHSLHHNTNIASHVCRYKFTNTVELLVGIAGPQIKCR